MEKVSVSQSVNEFRKYANKKLKILTLKKRKGDMIQIIAVNKNLKKFIRWKPKYSSLSAIVKSCIYWERKIKNPATLLDK